MLDPTWKNACICSANVVDTFCNFFHRVCIDVGVLVQFPEVLNNSEALTLFFVMLKMGKL